MASAVRTELACLQDAERVRPIRIAREAFRAWHGNGEPIDVTAATSLDEALNLAAPQSGHKRNFVIEETRADSRRFVHFYGVTKSTKRGTWRNSYDGGPHVFEGNCEAKHLLSMQIDVPFSPVAPWRWSPADPTGARHGLCADLAGALL